MWLVGNLNDSSYRSVLLWSLGNSLGQGHPELGRPVPLWDIVSDLDPCPM